MEIATLTYQRHDNYGAMLQCYALQKKLIDLGVETEVIDYIYEISKNPFGLHALKAKGIKRYITGIIGAATRLPRAKKFKEFRRLLNMSKTVTEKNISQLGASYDGYIAGSDNIWNADITGLDANFFLSFVFDKRKRTSFAASFGSSKIKEAHKERYKSLLNDFAVLTCREKSGVDLIYSLTGKKADMVCDPSLLLSANEWDSIVKEPHQKKKYLLAYQMVPSGSFVKLVSEVAKAKNLKVIYVPFPYGLIKCKPQPAIGPMEWLGLFKNAEYIITDSFHGCAFSVIFHKQFAVKISQLGERIDNLLTVLNIKDRIVSTSTDVHNLKDIDYSAVEALLEELRVKSVKKLKEILEHFESLTSNGIVDPSQCTGCLACKKVCPCDAIETVHDDLGFLHPEIIEEKCISCGKCEQTCSSIVTRKNCSDKQGYFAAINKNKDIVKKSGSGGIFHAIADDFVKNGGTVYGAAYQKGFAISHERACVSEELPNIMGTKYTQSSIFDIYDSVINDLSSNISVLFVGTPCQCAAVKEYVFQKHLDDSNLYVVDLFCHGVLSPKMWNEYLRFLESNFNEKITFISFRDKAKGWRNKYLKVTTEKKDISDFCNTRASMLRIYEQNLSFRDSCYQCHYMSLERVGDISIGDFWGIERVAPRLDNNTGVSAVLVNTTKGELLKEKLRGKTDFYEFGKGDIMQQVLKEPTKAHSKRVGFIDDYKKCGIEVILAKYGQVKGKSKLKRDIIVPLLYKFRITGLVSRILHNER